MVCPWVSDLVLALVAHSLPFEALARFVRRLRLTLTSRLFSLGLSSLLRECSFDHSQASLGLLEFKLYGLGLWVMSVYSAGTALTNELLFVDLVIMLVGPRCASPVDLFACV